MHGNFQSFERSNNSSQCTPLDTISDDLSHFDTNTLQFSHITYFGWSLDSSRYGVLKCTVSRVVVCGACNKMYTILYADVRYMYYTRSRLD